MTNSTVGSLRLSTCTFGKAMLVLMCRESLITVFVAVQTLIQLQLVRIFTACPQRCK